MIYFITSVTPSSRLVVIFGTFVKHVRNILLEYVTAASRSYWTFSSNVSAARLHRVRRFRPYAHVHAFAFEPFHGRRSFSTASRLLPKVLLFSVDFIFIIRMVASKLPCDRLPFNKMFRFFSRTTTFACRTRILFNERLRLFFVPRATLRRQMNVSPRRRHCYCNHYHCRWFACRSDVFVNARDRLGSVLLYRKPEIAERSDFERINHLCVSLQMARTTVVIARAVLPTDDSRTDSCLKLTAHTCTVDSSLFDSVPTG